MKIFDRIKIAAKELKGIWTVLIAFGMAAAAFCLCFAGAILVSVSDEQSMPYEINVSGSEGLKDADITKISAIPDIKAATLVFEVPVTIKTGEYSAEMSLTGIDSSYIDEKFSQGGVFQDSSAMPYIILNKAACKLFAKPGSNPSADETEDEKSAPDINWLSTGFTIQSGSDKNTVFAKVCGILAEKYQQDQQNEQPAGYISITAAKQLLKEGSEGLTTADVRVRNIGCAAAVSLAIENLGYQVSNPNEEKQKKWDAEYGEMAYLITGAVFMLFFIAILSTSRRKIYLLQQKEAYVMLRWMGMNKKEISSLFTIQSVILSLTGVAVGIVITLLLPSFLSQDLKGISVYMLPIPFMVAVVSVIICLLTGLLSLLNCSKSIDLDYS